MSREASELEAIANALLEGVGAADDVRQAINALIARIEAT